jgi:mRNA-degrading endonuclease toxin of MazEF toxin-antitoxin module
VSRVGSYAINDWLLGGVDTRSENMYLQITSKTKGLSFEVPLLEGTQTKGVVLADQIKTLDWKARKVKFIESVSQDLIEEVQAKLETLIF